MIARRLKYVLGLKPRKSIQKICLEGNVKQTQSQKLIVSATRRRRDIKMALSVDYCAQKVNIVSNDHGRT